MKTSQKKNQFFHFLLKSTDSLNVSFFRLILNKTNQKIILSLCMKGKYFDANRQSKPNDSIAINSIT